MALEIKKDGKGGLKVVDIDFQKNTIEFKPRSTCFKHIGISEEAFSCLYYMKAMHGGSYSQMASKAIIAVYKDFIEEENEG